VASLHACQPSPGSVVHQYEVSSQWALSRAWLHFTVPAGGDYTRDTSFTVWVIGCLHCSGSLCFWVYSRRSLHSPLGDTGQFKGSNQSRLSSLGQAPRAVRVPDLHCRCESPDDQGKETQCAPTLQCYPPPPQTARHPVTYLMAPAPVNLLQAGKSSKAGLLQAASGCAPRLRHTAVRAAKLCLVPSDHQFCVVLLLPLLLVALPECALNDRLHCWCTPCLTHWRPGCGQLAAQGVRAEGRSTSIRTIVATAKLNNRGCSC
jgi:hypothetical protein